MKMKCLKNQRKIKILLIEYKMPELLEKVIPVFF
jgi:hypothetical protein